MPHIQAELKACGINPRKLEKNSSKELKELLMLKVKEDELKHVIVETKQEGLKVSSIKYIKPTSEEMNMLFSLANQVEQRWLGILDIDYNVDDQEVACGLFIMKDGAFYVTAIINETKNCPMVSLAFLESVFDVDSDAFFVSII